MIRSIQKFVAASVSFALALALVPAVTLSHPQLAEATSSTTPTLEVARVATGKVALAKGASYKLGVAASKGATLSYASSSSGVVSVSRKGALKAKKLGRATITVKATKSKKTAKKKIAVTVVAASKYRNVKSLSLKSNKQSLSLGESATIKTTITPSNASNKNIVFTSSDSSIATVSSQGKVKAVGSGFVTITAMSCANPKVKASVDLMVSIPVEGNPDINLIEGDTVDIETGREPTVTYTAGVKDLEGADYEAAEDGSYTIADASIQESITTGDIVVLQPTEDNPGGAALKVDTVSYEGSSVTLSGTEPAIEDVYQDVELEGNATTVAFQPAEGVELEDASLQTAAKASRASRPSDASDIDIGKVKLSIPSYKLNNGDSVKISLSVKPTLSYKLSMQRGKISTVYVGVGVKNTVDVKVESPNAAGMLAGEDGYIKLGQLKGLSSVPGVEVGVTLYAVLKLDGSVGITASAAGDLGYLFTGGKSYLVHEMNNSLDGLTYEANLKAGFEFDASLYIPLIKKPVADAALGAGAKVSGKAIVRPTGMLCLDATSAPYVAASAGTHSYLKDFGITWSYDADLSVYNPRLKNTYHFENLKLVPKCTWNEKNANDSSSSNPSVQVIDAAYASLSARTVVACSGHKADFNSGNWKVSLLEDDYHLIAELGPDDLTFVGWYQGDWIKSDFGMITALDTPPTSGLISKNPSDGPAEANMITRQAEVNWVGGLPGYDLWTENLGNYYYCVVELPENYTVSGKTTLALHVAIESLGRLEYANASSSDPFDWQAGEYVLSYKLPDGSDLEIPKACYAFEGWYSGEGALLSTSQEPPSAPGMYFAHFIGKSGYSGSCYVLYHRM